jgi:hypothetical protein
MSEPFEGWAIVELMGHRRLAGYVTEQEVAGHGFLRLDVHDTDGTVATQLYSPSAVYCLTPTTEAISRGLGERLRPAPVHAYELPAPRPADTRAVHGPDCDDPGCVGDCLPF